MDVTELLTEYGIRFVRQGEHKHARRGWVQIDCPWCGRGSERYHFGINVVFRNANCYRCGRHRLGDTLAELTRKPLREVLAKLGGLAREVLPERPVGRLVLPNGLADLLPAHKRYLRGRGFDPALLEKVWGIRGIGIAAKLGWRVWIPIHFRGSVVSWTTRAIGNVEMRYVSAAAEQEAIPHKTILYGEDYVRNTIVVQEGPIDTWAVGPGSVCTCGTGYSAEQAARISMYPNRVICFDNEPAAQRRAADLCDLLAVLPGQTHNVQLDAKDAADALVNNPGEITLLRKSFLDF